MPQSDRRIFARFQVDIPAEIEQPQAKKSTVVQCYDISAGGIGFVSDVRIAPQTDLQVRMAIPDSKVPLRTAARVVWIEQIYENKWRSGLEFDNVDLVELSRFLQKNNVLCSS